MNQVIPLSAPKDIDGLGILGWEDIITHVFTVQSAYTLHDHTTSIPHAVEVD